MKGIILFIIISLGGCSHQWIQASTEINDLKAIMAYGHGKDLNVIDKNFDKDLLVRLHELPLFTGNCFLETHGVCQNKYYVSVSTFDKHPEINVYPLSLIGEVSGVRWIKDNTLDYVEIELTLNKYTKQATRNNASLVNRVSTVMLKLDTRKLVEITKRP